MEKMKLAKALKVKNRLAGEIGKLKALILGNNVIRSRIINPGIEKKVFKRERVIDVAKALDDLASKVGELIELKTAITQANVGIYAKMVEMEEAKGMMAFYDGLPQEREDDTDTDGGVTTVTHWDQAISSKVKMEKQELIKKRIEDLQDEIDEYNGTTYIG